MRLNLRLKTWHFWLIGATLLGFLATIAFILRDDIKKDSLDPKIPFQIYEIPESPNYSKDSAWFLNPAMAKYFADPRKVDVFFIHGTSFDGGKHWLGPITDKRSQAEIIERQLPNYAAPFAVVGNLYVPKYRQASLYSQFSLHEDAREAREFPYRDVVAAFDAFLKTRTGGHGFVLVGLEQGGLLAQRLIVERIDRDPTLKAELVAAYLMETAVPVSMLNYGVGACQQRNQSGCLLSYLSVDFYRPDKALTILQRSVQWQWYDEPAAMTEAEPKLTPPKLIPPKLMPMNGEPVLCVNPILGMQSDEESEARLSLGAANATGLDWPTQPALTTHKVTAECKNGLLIVKGPSSPIFQTKGSWEELKKVRSYNLFYGDLQTDLKTRWLEFQLHQAVPAA